MVSTPTSCNGKDISVLIVGKCRPLSRRKGFGHSFAGYLTLGKARVLEPFCSVALVFEAKYRRTDLYGVHVVKAILVVVYESRLRRSYVVHKNGVLEVPTIYLSENNLLSFDHAALISIGGGLGH